MDNFEDNNPQNIYVIKRKLTTYRKEPGVSYWLLSIGPFELKIKPNGDYWALLVDGDDSIIKHDTFHVDLYENLSKSDLSKKQFIYLNRDSRFKDYEPIQYNILKTPTGGIINLSDGKDMPQLHLFELIRLLYRLSNLTAFM